MDVKIESIEKYKMKKNRYFKKKKIVKILIKPKKIKVNNNYLLKHSDNFIIIVKELETDSFYQIKSEGEVLYFILNTLHPFFHVLKSKIIQKDEVILLFLRGLAKYESVTISANHWDFIGFKNDLGKLLKALMAE